MADFRIFITAASADYKVINELLLYLRDWEYGSGDTFHLQTSKTIEEHVRASETPVSIPVAIPGTITASKFHNSWADASIEEVETFAAGELDKIASPQAHVSFFIVLDEQGVKDHTVLCVAEDEPEDSDNEDNDNNDDDDDDDDNNNDNSDGKDGGQSDPQHACQTTKPTGDAVKRYNKVRMPWHGAYLFCANLGESNMGFEEFCDQDLGPDEQLYWRGNEDLIEDDSNGEDALERRAKLLQKLRNEGMI